MFLNDQIAPPEQMQLLRRLIGRGIALAVLLLIWSILYPGEPPWSGFVPDSEAQTLPVETAPEVISSHEFRQPFRHVSLISRE